jgi:hypothetical protein
MKDMKKILNIILAGVVLVAGLASCSGNKEQLTTGDTVDLRYRVADSYDLDAISPKSFVIVVKSTKPWTITSKHPDWCIIEQEEGEAVADSLVHVGKGENTTVKVQYYDNTELDDRTDFITIASNGFVGKTVTVNQKGIAYLNVPEADIEGGLMIEKAGGNLTVNVKSNQKWTAKIVPEGADKANWLAITDGASGELDGKVTVTVQENTGEKRYSNVAIYDRHGEERAMIKITQDGVQLDPATFEIRAGYDQLSTTLDVVCNTSWEATWDGDWFIVDNPTGHTGNGTLTITITKNEGTSLRKGSISLKTIAANAGDAVAEKEIVFKQAYKIEAVRHIMDNDEMGSWKSDWANPPVYTPDSGTLFAAKSRLNNSMPFGTYTFRWKGWAGGARIRHWFCFSESCEMKFDIRPIDAKCSFDFNVAGDGNKPSIDGFTAIDWTKPIEITYKFDPSGSEYCHVTYLVKQDDADAAVAGSFDTSANLLRTIKWNASINMYVGVDQVSDQDPGSAILEWYEYTAPMNWDE